MSELKTDNSETILSYGDFDLYINDPTCEAVYKSYDVYRRINLNRGIKFIPFDIIYYSTVHILDHTIKQNIQSLSEINIYLLKIINTYIKFKKITHRSIYNEEISTKNLSDNDMKNLVCYDIDLISYNIITHQIKINQSTSYNDKDRYITLVKLHITLLFLIFSSEFCNRTWFSDVINSINNFYNDSNPTSLMGKILSETFIIDQSLDKNIKSVICFVSDERKTLGKKSIESYDKHCTKAHVKHYKGFIYKIIKIVENKTRVISEIFSGPFYRQNSNEMLQFYDLSDDELSDDRIDDEQLDHEQLDHEQLDHKQLDHEQLDHEQLDHEQLDHEQLDHEQLDHKQSTELSINSCPEWSYDTIKENVEKKIKKTFDYFIKVMLGKKSIESYDKQCTKAHVKHYKGVIYKIIKIVENKIRVISEIFSGLFYRQNSNEMLQFYDLSDDDESSDDRIDDEQLDHKQSTELSINSCLEWSYDTIKENVEKKIKKTFDCFIKVMYDKSIESKQFEKEIFYVFSNYAKDDTKSTHYYLDCSDYFKYSSNSVHLNDTVEFNTLPKNIIYQSYYLSEYIDDIQRQIVASETCENTKKTQKLTKLKNIILYILKKVKTDITKTNDEHYEIGHSLLYILLKSYLDIFYKGFNIFNFIKMFTKENCQRLCHFYVHLRLVDYKTHTDEYRHNNILHTLNNLLKYDSMTSSYYDYKHILNDPFYKSLNLEIVQQDNTAEKKYIVDHKNSKIGYFEYLYDQITNGMIEESPNPLSKKLIKDMINKSNTQIPSTCTPNNYKTYELKEKYISGGYTATVERSNKLFKQIVLNEEEVHSNPITNIIKLSDRYDISDLNMKDEVWFRLFISQDKKRQYELDYIFKNIMTYDIEYFKDRINTTIGFDLIDFADTNKLCIAGGFMYNLIHEKLNRKEYKNYDIDLFITDETDKDILFKHLMSLSTENNILITKSKYAISMGINGISVQIIKINYKNVYILLNAFDIPISQIAYYENDLYFTDISIYENRNNFIIFNPIKDSKSYGFRLKKYSKNKSINVHFPFAKATESNDESCVFSNFNKTANIQITNKCLDLYADVNAYKVHTRFYDTIYRILYSRTDTLLSNVLLDCDLKNIDEYLDEKKLFSAQLYNIQAREYEISIYTNSKNLEELDIYSLNNTLRWLKCVYYKMIKGVSSFCYKKLCFDDNTTTVTEIKYSELTYENYSNLLNKAVSFYDYLNIIKIILINYEQLALDFSKKKNHYNKDILTIKEDAINMINDIIEIYDESDRDLFINSIDVVDRKEVSNPEKYQYINK